MVRRLWMRIHASSPLARWMWASMTISAILLVWSKSPSGDLLSGFTDHMHHSRATWTFLNVGFDVYRLPFDVTGGSVAYPQYGITWPEWPIAYPPGMFVVFLPPALIGRYIRLSGLEYVKMIIGYLTLIMHLAVWQAAPVFLSVRSKLWTAVYVVVWIFAIRAALLGFYDGAWLLTASLACVALQQQKYARGLLWVLASALLSYRAACLAPFGIYAAIGMWRSGDAMTKKLLVTLAGVVTSAIVVGTFWLLLKYSPKDGTIQSSLLPISYRGYAILVMGLLVAAYLAYASSLLVGGCVAVASGLSILHAGHTWHGFVCLGPLLAMALAAKRTLASQIVLVCWLYFFWEYCFDYTPMRLLNELIRFTEYNGAFPP